jgi:methyl-accepting chemotaxis protein
MSVRLSLWVVTFVAVLLVATLTVMYHFSYQAVKEEAVAKAMLTLDRTVLTIDNVLVKVEVAGRMMRWNMERHLDDSKALSHDCRQMVEDNPMLIGGAIAMDTAFFHRHFIIYTYREDTSTEDAARHSRVLESDHYDKNSYLEQTWYTHPMENQEDSWVRPYEQGEYKVKPTTFSLLVHNAKQEAVGVLGLDVSLNWFSSIIKDTKPFPNSYCAMIGRRGKYIIHPDTTRIDDHSVFERINGAEHDTKMELLIESMIAGESGYRVVDIDGQSCYVFYKPFRQRGWIATIVCPESEIMGGTIRLLWAVLAIAVVGLILLLLFCLFYIDRNVRPLGLLAQTARRLSEGHYDDHVPDTRRVDEIGSLQNSFKAMQQSIANRIDEIQQVNARLEDSNAALQEASERAQEAERTMNNFLINLSDQMLQPVVNIEQVVSDVRKNYRQISQQEAEDMVNKIHTETDIVTELLYQLLEVSQKEGGKA